MFLTPSPTPRSTDAAPVAFSTYNLLLVLDAASIIPMPFIQHVQTTTDYSFISSTFRHHPTPKTNIDRSMARQNELKSKAEQRTFPPGVSPLSSAIRSATAMALIRRGCVQTILQLGPKLGSSRTNCGTCVDFPQPVSPDTRQT